ncbi:hypothetical protein V8E54_002397 [Elaphomyces granulatus]
MAACPTIHRRLILGRYEEDGAMLESLMTSMNTKVQDGPKRRTARICGKQMLAGSVQCPSTLRSLTALSSEGALANFGRKLTSQETRFWSEVARIFAELDNNWQFFQQDIDEFGFDEAAGTVVEPHC